MKSLIAILLALHLLPIVLSAQEGVAVVKFEDFEPRLHRQSDSVYLVNFWASWCMPCRQEMPAIQQLSKDFYGRPLKVLLVSLDFPAKLVLTLYPYLKTVNNQYEVVVLNSPDFNSWIEKVDSSWSGAIPATLIYSSYKRQFFEKSFSHDELHAILQEHITNVELKTTQQ